MSDLCSSNCGCERDVNYGCGCGSNGYDNRSGGMSSCLWIILLLIFCGGNSSSVFGHNGDGCGCDSCIWIILLLIFCGGWNFGSCGC